MNPDASLTPNNGNADQSISSREYWSNDTQKTGYLNSLSLLRNRALTLLLVTTSIVGLAILIALIPLSIREKQWGSLVIAGAGELFLFLLLIAHQLPYQLRANGLLCFIYGVGLLALVDGDPNGSAKLILLVLPILACILINVNAGIIWIILSTGAIFVADYLFTSGLIRFIDLPPEPGYSQVISWTIENLSFLLICLGVTLATAIIIQGLEQSLRQTKSITYNIENNRAQLEQLAKKNAIALDYRLNQMRSAAEISRSMNGLFEEEHLSNTVATLIHDGFDLYYVGVFLIDKGQEVDLGKAKRFSTILNKYAILKGGSGEAGERMIAEGHKLLVGGESMIGWATENGKARIALDVGKEPIRFNNPYLPETRSELALPIIVGKKVLGAISIQSNLPSAFDQDDITVLQNIADSLGTAIENSRLLTGIRENLNEIESLHRLYLTQAWSDLMVQTGEISYTYESLHPIKDVASNPYSTGSLTAEDSEASNHDGEEHGIRYPLSLRNQVIGHIEFEGNREQFSEEEERFIESILDQAALALENARLMEATRKQAAQKELATNVSGKVWASTDSDTILRTALFELSRNLKVEEGLIEINLSGK